MKGKKTQKTRSRRAWACADTDPTLYCTFGCSVVWKTCDAVHAATPPPGSSSTATSVVAKER